MVRPEQIDPLSPLQKNMKEEARNKVRLKILQKSIQVLIELKKSKENNLQANLTSYLKEIKTSKELLIKRIAIANVNKCVEIAKKTIIARFFFFFFKVLNYIYEKYKIIIIIIFIM
jgi:hypothetical protein